MGWRYEVLLWGKHINDEYSYKQMYAGHNLTAALREVWRLKKGGAGCINFVYRP